MAKVCASCIQDFDMSHRRREKKSWLQIATEIVQELDFLGYDSTKVSDRGLYGDWDRGLQEHGNRARPVCRIILAADEPGTAKRLGFSFFHEQGGERTRSRKKPARNESQTGNVYL